MSDATATESKVAVMDQLPSVVGPRAEGPLFHVSELSASAKSSGQGGVFLQELPLLGHLVLRGNVEDKGFTQAIQKVLGVELPGVLQFVSTDVFSIRWISPDEWLLVCVGNEAFHLEQQLRESAQGHFAIVNVSGAQTVLVLSGDNARDVLMKSTPYDVHDSNFPVGKVVTSVFAKTQAVISRTGENTWEIITRRSFADYMWLWLQDASMEFGLVLGDAS